MRKKQLQNNRRYRVFSVTVIMVCLLQYFGSNSAAQETIQIYAPSTPSSIPLIIAAQNLEQTEITLFSNHSQAHTLFLRGDIQILMTGLSVGVNFFKNGVPVQLFSSYVSGLTYLVTRDRQVTQFRELQGEEIYLPFKGAPIEEITKFFVEQEDLKWEEMLPVYLAFPSSLELLKEGKARAVALPEPFATMATTQKDIFRSFGYKATWDALVGGTDGYPQVGLFVNTAWAAAHREFLHRLNREIEKALQLIDTHPEEALSLTAPYLKFPEAILRVSLQHTDFALQTSQNLKQEIIQYYEVLGKPLDETFDAFFYLNPE